MILMFRVRYGRIQNQNKLTDILITDPNVHHQVTTSVISGRPYIT